MLRNRIIRLRDITRKGNHFRRKTHIDVHAKRPILRIERVTEFDGHQEVLVHREPKASAHAAVEPFPGRDRAVVNAGIRADHLSVQDLGDARRAIGRLFRQFVRLHDGSRVCKGDKSEFKILFHCLETRSAQAQIGTGPSHAVARDTAGEGTPHRKGRKRIKRK